MARHMRNGRDYSRPGPKVDYELRKDSNNAARSGEVYNKIEGIQSQIVPTASIEMGETASKAYNIGDFLVKDGILYKVTKAIAKNDALTVGTNIELGIVCSELSEISERLSQMSQSEYKIKEYVFENTKVSQWIIHDIDESNVFLDGSSYLDSTDKIRYPLNYSADNYKETSSGRKMWKNTVRR